MPLTRVINYEAHFQPSKNKLALSIRLEGDKNPRRVAMDSYVEFAVALAILDKRGALYNPDSGWFKVPRRLPGQ